MQLSAHKQYNLNTEASVLLFNIESRSTIVSTSAIESFT